jgi:hypothetical protein
MKLRTLIPLLFFVSFGAIAQSSKCDGTLQVYASSQCKAPMIDSWKEHIIPLYKTGHLNLSTDAVIADCTCDGGAGTNVAFCTATYSVHGCMVDKEGAFWFSKEAKIIGVTNSVFNDGVTPQDLSGKLQNLSMETAGKAAINLKNEVLKHKSKSK